MTLEDLIDYRNELINDSLDENKTLSENLILRTVAPALFENKLLDSEDLNEINFNKDDSKINGYKINDTGERLQIFIVNEDSIKLDVEQNKISVSLKKIYEDVFQKATKFIKSSIKGYLNLDNVIQDSDPLGLLNLQLSTANIDEIDVIEIFLISFTASISNNGAEPKPKEFVFNDETIETTFTKERLKYSKKILIIKRLIDLNYLFTVSEFSGKGLEVDVDFEEYFGKPVEVLRAASGHNFESYLCVLSAEGLSSLYKKENSRLLEKNVRSFLQFTGTNKGMKKTIKSSPEKFIAFNNGLTITATGKELIESDNKIFLRALFGFQIVNGGQTTASLYFSKKEGLSLEGINVMAKINVVNDNNEEELNQLVSDISLYSNTQTKVSKVDLNSKNEQLSKIKKFSISVLTPTNKKWFFESKKGEYKTELLLAGKSRRTKFEKEYPKNRLISKEELGKYYMSWGQKPFLVKLGGDKLFRYFLEDLEGDGVKIKPKEINRDFYEEVISKVILFKNLEIIHGDSRAKNNIGNLRSAVIPYALAILNRYTDDSKNKKKFNLLKIWKSEKIEDDLICYMYDLMSLVNELIKKYSKTDDYGQYSKKEALWDDIKDSKEIKEFMASENSNLVIRKYTIEYDNIKVKKNEKDIDFENLLKATKIFDFDKEFFTQIESYYNIDSADRRRIEKVKYCIQKIEDIDPDVVLNVNKLLNKLKSENKREFENLLLKYTNKSVYESTLNYIIGVLSDCISNNLNITSTFNKIKEIANLKGAKYSSVYGTIGSKFEKGELLSIKDIFYASYYIQAISKIQDEIKSKNEQINKPLIYLKKIISQDLERTPSFSIEAIHDFFNISLNHSEIKIIKMNNLTTGSNFDIEFKKRETRGEYRIFLNALFKEISPKEKDIILFRKIDKDRFTCEHISIESNKYNSLNENFELNKNHKLLVESN